MRLRTERNDPRCTLFYTYQPAALKNGSPLAPSGPNGVPSQLGSENPIVQLQILLRRLIAFSPQSADELLQRFNSIAISPKLGALVLLVRFHLLQGSFRRLNFAAIYSQLGAQLHGLPLQGLDVELERLVLLLELVDAQLRVRVIFSVRYFAHLPLLCIRFAVPTYFSSEELKYMGRPMCFSSLTMYFSSLTI